MFWIKIGLTIDLSQFHNLISQIHGQLLEGQLARDLLNQNQDLLLFLVKYVKIIVSDAFKTHLDFKNSLKLYNLAS